jgi:predicted transcriptional regulator
VTTLTAQVPDSLYGQVQHLASREAMSLDQLVAMALSAQLSTWEAKQYLDERAARGDWGKFEAILKRVPDREPDPEDQFN